MSNLMVAITGALTALLFAGCGGDGAYPTPAESCATYIDAWCSQTARCVAPSESANFSETCKFASRLEIDCAKVLRVSNQYEACIDAVHALTCNGYTDAQGLPLPERCRGVLVHD